MFNVHQSTIANPISAFGIGVHSGKHITIRLVPAAADTGIVFKRTDVESHKSLIPATYLNVTETMMNTTIANEFGTKVATIEHLMAALWGMGIDNLIIEIDGAEVPIMDGSSQNFVFLLECAGVKKLTKARRILEILKTVEIEAGSSFMRASPCDEYVVDMGIEFNNKIIAKQSFMFKHGQLDFKNELSRARTFGFAEDVAKLQAMGLAKGGSLDNAIVIEGDRILNDDGLRYENEFARHKVLDCVGDYYLSGYSYIKGRFEGMRPGHAMNNKILRELLADESAYRIVELAA